jgi:hypothetical protein
MAASLAGPSFKGVDLAIIKHLIDGVLNINELTMGTSIDRGGLLVKCIQSFGL